MSRVYDDLCEICRVNDKLITWLINEELSIDYLVNDNSSIIHHCSWFSGSHLSFKQINYYL